MEFRIDHPSEDEFEEVESPFNPRVSQETSARDKLRNKKNVFNRPFATAPSVAPVYVDTKSTRKLNKQYGSSEMIHNNVPSLAETEIDYLDDHEEEKIEKRSVRSHVPSNKKNLKSKKNIIFKLAWAVVGILVLRLIFMDRGVWDYFATEGIIKEKKEELALIQSENKNLVSEISKIQTDRNYQKFLAKEHLGVIAADEFLILFANESEEMPTSAPI